jgi:hypothetical protein
MVQGVDRKSILVVLCCCRPVFAAQSTAHSQWRPAALTVSVLKFTGLRTSARPHGERNCKLTAALVLCPSTSKRSTHVSFRCIRREPHPKSLLPFPSHHLCPLACAPASACCVSASCPTSPTPPHSRSHPGAGRPGSTTAGGHWGSPVGGAARHAHPMMVMCKSNTGTLDHCEG